LLYKTTTNQLGEVVTTSNNLTQIVTNIPEVNSAVLEITAKYNIEASSVTLVESKGKTTKEIKIVSQTTDQTTGQVSSIAFTVLVTGSQTTIIDVQTPQKPEVTIPSGVNIYHPLAPSAVLTVE